MQPFSTEALVRATIRVSKSHILPGVEIHDPEQGLRMLAELVRVCYLSIAGPPRYRYVFEERLAELGLAPPEPPSLDPIPYPSTRPGDTVPARTTLAGKAIAKT